jgi:DNA-binding transcriptional regulator YiaG
MKRIKINIARLRKQYDMSLEEIAYKLGFSYAAVWRWEQKGSMPQVHEKRLMEILKEKENEDAK